MTLKENRGTVSINIKDDELWYWEGRSFSLENLNGKIYGNYNEVTKYLDSNNIKIFSIYPLKNSSKNDYDHYLIFDTLLIIAIILTLGLVLSSVNLFNISSKTVFLILINVFLWIKIGKLLKT